MNKATENRSISTPAGAETSLMSDWEMGSPMRNFIYYLQRATCGALAYLVIHQSALGLRLMQVEGTLRSALETTLSWASIPGDFCLRWFGFAEGSESARPFGLPFPLALFVANIAFYFMTTWIVCYAMNLIGRTSFVGKKRDPFKIKPQGSSAQPL